jgi:NAD(P)-dependent dehydrogenase (short-subunit alcohol dehydrogenase family)
MDEIKDKVAIVTGGSTLIGAAVVRAFHKAGARVGIADIDEKNGEKIAGELKPKNRRPSP